MKEGRRSVPIDGDGGTHRCQEMQDTLKSIRRIDPTSLSPEERERYLRPVEKKKK